MKKIQEIKQALSFFSFFHIQKIKTMRLNIKLGWICCICIFVLKNVKQWIMFYNNIFIYCLMLPGRWWLRNQIVCLYMWDKCGAESRLVGHKFKYWVFEIFKNIFFIDCDLHFANWLFIKNDIFILIWAHVPQELFTF